MCELVFADDTDFVRLLGGKNGSRELTFVAKVTNDSNYNGVIFVVFEKNQK